MLPRNAELVPAFGVCGIERGRGLELRECLAEVRGVIQSVAEQVPVIEIFGIERDGGLELRNAAARVLLEPPGDAEMVMCGREFWIEFCGPLEVLQRLFAPIQDDEQETDFVLNARRLGIERGGLLPGGKRAGRIAPRFQFDSAGLDLPQRLLAGRGRRDDGQQEEETERAPRVMNTTLHCIRSSAAGRTAISASGPGWRCW